jgi:hypothetical protein
MTSEHDAAVRWSSLFHVKTITEDTLRSARKLLEQLPLESPVRARLTAELEEILELQRSQP